MAEEKRKTKTSTAVKQRYIDKTYDIISARVPKELVRLSRQNAPPRAYRKRRLSKRR